MNGSLIRRSNGTSSRTTGRSIALAAAALLFVGFGLFGSFRYIWTFWLYRGFAAPATPTHLSVGNPSLHLTVKVIPGTIHHITVTSPSLGGAKVPVIVYLPPGYATHPHRHYPTFYLLHGSPGGPQQFIDVANVQGAEATLVAEHKMAPMILVMPSGTLSFFVDNEWVNGVHPDSGWTSFVADDLVNAIDHRYRAIASGSSRAIGGDSEGGYGALNIDFHHVGEFRVLETWSGYMEADNTPAIFGHDAKAVADNSPNLTITTAYAPLRATHTYIWMYSGTKDFTAHLTARFANELHQLLVPYTFRVVPGHHNWALWRSQVPNALMVASEHLRDQ